MRFFSVVLLMLVCGGCVCRSEKSCPKLKFGAHAVTKQGRPEVFFEHVVYPGESLEDISAQYGVSVDDLMTSNGLSDPRSITTGMQLWIGRMGFDEPDGDRSDPSGESVVSLGVEDSTSGGGAVSLKQYQSYREMLQACSSDWLYTNTVQCTCCNQQGMADLSDGTMVYVPWEPPLNKDLVMAYNAEAGPVLVDPETDERIPFYSETHPLDLIVGELNTDQSMAEMVIDEAKGASSWGQEIDRLYHHLSFVLPEKEVERSRDAWESNLDSQSRLIWSSYENIGTLCVLEHAGMVSGFKRDHAMLLNRCLIQRLWNIGCCEALLSE